jgi:alcohol dehydrogenase
MNDVKQTLLSVISSQFSLDVGDIKESDGPGDILGWDSIGQLQLILKIEQTFNVSFSIDDVMSINTISDITNIINEKFVTEAKTEEKTPVKQLLPLAKNHTPHNIFIGVDGISRLFTQEGVNNIAIVTGSYAYAEELFEMVKNNLGDGFQVTRFAKPSGEPREQEILTLSEQLNEFDADLVLAIGGGSVIDAAKLAWVLYENPSLEMSNIEMSIGNAVHRNKAKLAVIPTTYGSGSEASSAAAFNKQDSISKTIVVSHQMLPDYVFFDPNFGMDMPQGVLFASAMDALTHAIEGYVSLIENSFAENLAVLAINNLISAMKDIILRDVNTENLTKLMYGAYWAGMVQNQCSVGATHALAHQMNSYGLSHGQANSLFILPVFIFNSEKTNKYQTLLIDLDYKHLDELIIDIQNIIQKKKIISDLDVEMLQSNKESIINGAEKDITFKTNPVSLTHADLSQIFNNALNSIS